MHSIAPRNDFLGIMEASAEPNNIAELCTKVGFFYEDGRTALLASLKEINLKKADIVSILTSSNSQYISSCVTTTVDKICVYNREIVPETKAVIAISEFGYEIDLLKIRNIFEGPIIQDNAYAFPLFFRDRGCVEPQFSIYSMPKFWGGKSGGLLIKEPELDAYNKNKIDKIHALENIALRQKVYSYYQALNLPTGMRLVEITSDLNVCRSVCFIEISSLQLNKLEKIKGTMQELGVECTIFYPKPILLLPVNPTFKPTDIQFIVTALRIAYENNN